MDVLNEYFGRFGPTPKFLWRKRPACTASKSHALLQRYSSLLSKSQAGVLATNQSVAPRGCEIVGLVWVFAVLPSLARQRTTLQISPTCKSLWQAIVTFTRMEDAEEVSSSCPNEENGTADHCRYLMWHDVQHDATMSVIPKIGSKFPRYDPLIFCDTVSICTVSYDSAQDPQFSVCARLCDSQCWMILQ